MMFPEDGASGKNRKETLQGRTEEKSRRKQPIRRFPALAAQGTPQGIPRRTGRSGKAVPFVGNTDSPRSDLLHSGKNVDESCQNAARVLLRRTKKRGAIIRRDAHARTNGSPESERRKRGNASFRRRPAGDCRIARRPPFRDMRRMNTAGRRMTGKPRAGAPHGKTLTYCRTDFLRPRLSERRFALCKNACRRRHFRLAERRRRAPPSEPFFRSLSS